MVAPLIAVIAIFGLTLAWLVSVFLSPYAFAGGLVLAWLMFLWPLVRGGTFKPQPDTRLTGPGWERTEECFLDPTSGELLVVWHHSRTGERAYVRAV